MDAFILKNTDEIRNKLIRLGYRYSNTFDTTHPYLFVSSESKVFFDTTNITLETIPIGEYYGPYGHSCGTDEKLFFETILIK